MNSTNQNSADLEELKLQLRQLRDENQQLNANLIHVNSKLHDSERFKGHFISNVTNEIVNPFASIMAIAENLQRLKDGDIQIARQLGELIFDEAAHLDFQLKNIFSVAMIEAGLEQLNYSRVSVKQVFGEVKAYFDHLMKKKNIVFTAHYQLNEQEECSPEVVTDRIKLEMILKNLVSNSIKYSQEGSAIEVSFAFENQSFSLQVTDQGKGISSADMHIIFDRFRQLDEKINSINTGHGLGLSLAQAYTDMMGGTITLTNNADQGISAMVCLPQGETDQTDELDDFIISSEDSF